MSSLNENDTQLFHEFIDFITPTVRSVIPQLSNRNKIFVDVVNEEKNLTIYAEIPGVRREDIDIDFYNNKITILVVKQKNYSSTQISELKYGNFERQIMLPICVTKKETVSVSYNVGILVIKINKHIEEGNKFTVRLNDNEENDSD
jgi:HSP20 family protein